MNASQQVVLEVRSRESGREGRPQAWVLVTKAVESKNSPRIGAESSLYLRFELMHPPLGGLTAGSFQAHYRSTDAGGEISVTGGGVFMDISAFRGHRIGTYLMERIVEWAHQWPQASVLPITLEPDNHEENRTRRNDLYENMGFRFKYDDASTRRSGVSLPMTAGQLVTRSTWQENITATPLTQFLSLLLQANEIHIFEAENRRQASLRDAAAAIAYRRRPFWRRLFR